MQVVIEKTVYFPSIGCDGVEILKIQEVEEWSLYDFDENGIMIWLDDDDERVEKNVFWTLNDRKWKYDTIRQVKDDIEVMIYDAAARDCVDEMLEVLNEE